MKRFFATPSTDGNPGEVLAVDDRGNEQAFMACVSPWAANEQQLAELRQRVAEAETALRHAQTRRESKGVKRRLEAALESARHALGIAETEQRLQRRREQLGGEDVFRREMVNANAPGAASEMANNCRKIAAMSFADQTALLQTAMVELRRAGVA